jgi:hypothetical protein
MLRERFNNSLRYGCLTRLRQGRRQSFANHNIFDCSLNNA